MPYNEATASSKQESNKDRQEVLYMLDAFGQSLAKTRSEAIAARQQSGIENLWWEDEEFYEGVDDANRGEHHHAWRSKPPGQIQVTRNKNDTSSTVFPNITRPYVDMASARISDMLMPVDEPGFMIEPTPIPDLINIKEGKFPERMVGIAESQGSEEAKKQWLADQAAEAERIMDEARDKSNNAQKRISDWMEECGFNAQGRRALEDAARIGTGILKGPMPEVKDVKAYTEEGLVVKKETKPVTKRVDPWNIFPDSACGEDIHNGSYIWERDYISKRQLLRLREDDNYITENINACLKEGPQQATGEYKEKPEVNTDVKKQFQIWYYYGIADAEDIQALGVDIEDNSAINVPVMIIMVNNHVIKIAQNPLDTGDFPYDVMVWQRRSGYWAGIGVARQIRTPQRIITAATRNLMDNAGIAAGPMLVFLQGILSPADGELGLKPRKVFVVGEDATSIDDARKAIGSIKVDMLVNELIEIINLGLRFAEDVTGMPMILQGQMGQAPNTVGGMQMLFNSASSVLRRLAKLWDDLVTDPHVSRYYTWLLQYSDDDNEKGDFNINARGSSALVERSIQNEQLPQILAMSANPIYGLDPKNSMSEYLKSLRFETKKFEYDDDQWKELVANWQQILEQGKQQGDTRLAIAQENNATRIELQNIKDKNAEERAQSQRDFDAAMDQFNKTFDVKMKLLEGNEVTPDTAAKIKADLADTAMRLRTQLKLAGEKQVITPAVEPQGRAEPGKAFTQ